jgi:hypothetical protein
MDRRQMVAEAVSNGGVVVSNLLNRQNGSNFLGVDELVARRQLQAGVAPWRRKRQGSPCCARAT